MPDREHSHRFYPALHKGRFYNHAGEKKLSFMLCSLRMLLNSFFFTQDISQAMRNFWVEENTILQRSKELTVTWIGHATFLIQLENINILTDPVFNDLSFLYRRIVPPGIPLKKLPPIDFVLISHNHRDHMDANTLHMLKNHSGITFLVPQGDKKWFKARGFDRVVETMWWDRQKYISIYDGFTPIEFSFLPAFHWSQRGLLDYNRSLWGSWMITCNNSNLYFAGDTGYSSHFSAIKKEFSAIDVAFMPIGPCEPRHWLEASHISAEEAGRAFLELNAHHFIPMHWGTYPFGTDYFFRPLERLTNWWHAQEATLEKQLHIVKMGKQKLITVPQTVITPNIQPQQELLL